MLGRPGDTGVAFLRQEVLTTNDNYTLHAHKKALCVHYNWRVLVLQN